MRRPVDANSTPTPDNASARSALQSARRPRTGLMHRAGARAGRWLAGTISADDYLRRLARRHLRQTAKCVDLAGNGDGLALVEPLRRFGKSATIATPDEEDDP